jgi:hypothetical protein
MSAAPGSSRLYHLRSRRSEILRLVPNGTGPAPGRLGGRFVGAGRKDRRKDKRSSDRLIRGRGSRGATANGPSSSPAEHPGMLWLFALCEALYPVTLSATLRKCAVSARLDVAANSLK